MKKHILILASLLLAFTATATDVSITAANVIASSSATKVLGVAGATVAAGQLVYRDTGDSNKYKLVDADSGTALARVVYGIALNSASSGQPISVCTLDTAMEIGTHSVAVGTVLVASDTAGGLMPAADIDSGDYVTAVAVVKSSTAIVFGILASGAAAP